MRPRTFSTVLLLSVAALVCAALTAPAPSRATTSTTKGSKTTNSGYPSQDIAISTASVLLPPDPNVAFEIDAVNGCFTWYVLWQPIHIFYNLHKIGIRSC